MLTKRTGLALWLLLAAAICVLDQLTKLAATRYLDYGTPTAVMPSFNLTRLHNTGAAFSMLNDAAGWQRWLFSAIAVVVAGAVVGWLVRIDRSQRWEACALTFILGGALGNLIDRLRLGYVVDFIQVYFRAYSFPAFNIADSAITIGAVMMLLASAVTGTGRQTKI